IDSGVVDRIDRELVALLTAGATVIEAPDEVLRAGGAEDLQPDEARRRPRPAAEPAPSPEPVVRRRAESDRLPDASAGLLPTPGIAGEPLLPRRVPGDAVRASFRHDEQLLARRVRSLVERPLPVTPPKGEPLLASPASRAQRSLVAIRRG